MDCSRSKLILVMSHLFRTEFNKWHKSSNTTAENSVVRLSSVNYLRAVSIHFGENVSGTFYNWRLALNTARAIYLIFLILCSWDVYASEGFFNYRMFDGYLSIPDEFSVVGITIKGEKCFEAAFSRQKEGEKYDSQIIAMKYMNCSIEVKDSDKGTFKKTGTKLVNGFEVAELEYASVNQNLNGMRFIRASFNGAALYFFGENRDQFVERILKTYSEL